MNDATRNRLIEQYMPLVDHVLQKVWQPNLPVSNDELRSAGYLALTKAARTYDPGNRWRAKFKTYAYRAIKNEMWHEMKRHRTVVRVPFANDVTFQEVAMREEYEPAAPESAEQRTSAELRALRRAIKTLDWKKQFIVQSHLAGRTQRMIAADLGVTHQAVHMQLRMAREKIRRAIVGT